MPTVTGIATSFIDFTRASNATVTDSDGKVKWAPHNLLLNSESFDAASWAKTSGIVTITANQTVAPNGSTTADIFNEGTGAGYRLAEQAASTIASVTYTVGFYAKYISCQWVSLSLYSNSSATSYGAATFDLLNGAVGTSAAAGTGYAIVGSPVMEPVGAGWYRCSLTVVNGSSLPANYLAIAASNVGTIGNYGLNSYTGTSKTFSIWGASLYRSDLGGMQPNTSAYPMYNPTTPKNLLGYTEAYSGTGWARASVSVTADSVISPNGLLTADKLVPANGASSGNMYNNPGTTIVSGGTYTASVYVKAAELNFAYISLNARASSAAQGVCVNLTTGALSNQGVSATYSATSVGAGWWRVSCSGVSNTTAGYLEVFPLAAAGSFSSYTGDGASGIYVWGAQLSDSASLDAYSPAYGAAVTSAAYYGPRRDFDPVTLACKGLLVEEQRANLLTYSADFAETAAWTPDGATISSNVTATIAPDGTTTSDKLVENSATSGFHRLYRNAFPSISNSTAYTVSAYFKADGRSIFHFLFTDNVSSWAREFNLSSVSSTTVSGITSPTSYNITPLGNGWYRCSITMTSAASGSGGATGVFQVRLCNATGVSDYAGNGTSGVFIWGAQLEAGSFATSYIPTGAASATRNADVASVSTQAFPYSASEGTIVVAWQLAQLSGSPAAIHLTDAAESNRIRINAHLAGLNRSTITAAGALVDNIDTSTAATGITKYAIGGKSADYAVYRNGSAGGTSANAGFPSGCTEMRIGRDAATGNFNGHIRQITYLPRRISNTDLVTRTSA